MKLIKKSLSDPKMRVFFFIFLGSLLFGFNQASAQSYDAHTAKLVEGAKKEKQISLYSPTSVDDETVIIKAFQKKYPFIKVKHYRAQQQKIMSKVMTEYSMKKLLFDAIVSAPSRLFIYKKLGMLTSYASPERKAYADNVKDKEGYYTSVYRNTHVIAYNTKMVSKAEAPRNYQDLLDPKWKGNMGIDKREFSWFITQLDIMGKEKGLAYFRRLAKQDLQLRTGHTLLVQLCIAGEFPIVVNAYGSRVEKEKARGAPIEWVGVEPIIFHANAISLGKNSRHPNAAKLYIDFVLSEEGQIIYQKRQRMPSRNGVYPQPARLTQGLKLIPFNYALIAEKYAEIEDQWANILKGR